VNESEFTSSQNEMLCFNWIKIILHAILLFTWIIVMNVPFDDFFGHTSCISYWPLGKFLTLYSLDGNRRRSINIFFNHFSFWLLKAYIKCHDDEVFFQWDIWIWIYWKLCSCPCYVTYDKNGHFKEHECSQASIYHSTFTILTSLPFCFSFFHFENKNKNILKFL
jgi:hypothetical protein